MIILKNTKFIFVILFLCFGEAYSFEAYESKELSLVQILNDIQIMDEKKVMPIKVRLLKLYLNGECDGSLDSCPQEKLFVAVSAFDEFPKQKLFEFHDSYGWHSIKWLSWPKTEDPSQYVSFEISEKRISLTEGNELWIDCKYLVNVNLSRIFMQQIKGINGDKIECK